eukprot:CAMPEP_0185780926 /NCGR_PEP_ID=MMETSP1174-20130828/100656_1 /TAXON_ID=35687 /ORGANISM="Dictyocha speculum, Strain CCMP1381" /LENGTH=45 /DNA_ID= /DNA_START= /DNA_END= /DNA_ORIENTATION=
MCTDGSNTAMTAWDATSSRIPVLWTDAAAAAGIDDEEYATLELVW